MKRSRMIAGISLVTAVGVGGAPGAVVGVPGISGAQTFPNRAIVLDATTPTTPTHPVGQTLLDAAAQALGLTTQQLQQKLSDGKTTIADVAKQQNVELSKVIAAMVAADQSRINNIVNNPLPKFRGPGGPGGPAAFGPNARPGFRGGMGIGPLSASIDDIAKALGITTDQLMTDLKNGQSIADIAKSKNLDLNTVINTLVGDADARIDQAVKNGKLTQTQGDNLKSTVKTAITNLVNNGFPKFGGRMGGGRGFFGKPGGGAPSTVSPPTTAKPPTS